MLIIVNRLIYVVFVIFAGLCADEAMKILRTGLDHKMAAIDKMLYFLKKSI